MQGPGLALVALALAAGCVTGCAREVALVKGVGPVPAGKLTGGTWTVVSINGARVLAGRAAVIGFAAGDGHDGTVSGSAGCNRFNGAWRQSGDAIEIGALAMTRMACGPAVMAMEAKLTGVLGAVRRVYFGTGDTVRLVADDGRQLNLRRVAP
jgi:heat shock protein HslJ